MKEYALPIGSTIELSNTHYHTMACLKGIIWI